MDKRMIVFSLTGVILLVLIAACAQSTPAPVMDKVQGEALVVEKCSECHTTDRVFEADYTEDQWSSVIDRMINKGADVSPDEKEMIIDWLVSRE